MKGNIIINLSDGLYFYYGDGRIYFVEKKYINRSVDIVQLFMLLLAGGLSTGIPIAFMKSNLSGATLIGLLTFVYVFYAIIAINLISRFIDSNYVKKYEQFKTLISDKKKKELTHITKKVAVAYVILFTVFIVGAGWIYYLFLLKGELDDLLLSSFLLAGALFHVLPIIISLVKFHIRLTKELTE